MSCNYLHLLWGFEQFSISFLTQQSNSKNQTQSTNMRTRLLFVVFLNLYNFLFMKNFKHTQSKKNSTMNLYVFIIQFQWLPSFYPLSISLTNAHHLHCYYCIFTSFRRLIQYFEIHKCAFFFFLLFYRFESGKFNSLKCTSLSYKNLNNEPTYVSHTPMTIIESISHKIPLSRVTCWLSTLLFWKISL